MKKIVLLLVAVMLVTLNVSAQKKAGHPHHKNHKSQRHSKVVIKRSAYRPKKVVVFHPHWGSKRDIHRRWVFFPKYNLYWDNWRNHYYFYNGITWISQPTPPPVIVNVNLDNEKQYELKEDEDDIDDIYSTNNSHKSEYKSE